MELRYSRQFAAVLALGVSMGGEGLAAQRSEMNPEWPVPVYLENDQRVPPITLSRAQALASEIFATAGVRLRWHSGAAPELNKTAERICPAQRDRTVVISIGFTPPRHMVAKSSETLAYTFPYAGPGARITVLYERLQPAIRNSPRLSGILLAPVLVHEITHVLQRIDRHSESGVMKAHWTLRDYADMEQHGLPFASEDLLLIKLGLESWAREACAAPTFAGQESGRASQASRSTKARANQ